MREHRTVVVGSGYMAKVYKRHLDYLNAKSLLAVRNITSKSAVEAMEEFGNDSVVEIGDLVGGTFENVLCCTSVESHVSVLKKFKRVKRLFCEKPYTLDEVDLDDKGLAERVFILMNRRLYPWVAAVKELVTEGRVMKVAAFIPEESAGRKWRTVDENLATNSVHVFDLLSFISGGLCDTKYVESIGAHKTSILKSRHIDTVLIEIAMGARQNFSLRFFLDNGDLIECRPLEEARLINRLECIEPTEGSYIRKYVPKGSRFPMNTGGEEVEMRDLRKPGVLEVCRLIVSGKDVGNFLPNGIESFDMLKWVDSIYGTVE